MTTKVAASATRRRRSANRPAWMEPPTLVDTALRSLLLLAVVIIVLFPIYVVVATSLATQSDVSDAGGLVVTMRHIDFGAYRQILNGGVVVRSLIISLGVTTAGTALSTSVTILAAYGLSRSDVLGHRFMLGAVLFTFLFAPGIIPLYLTVRGLHLLDTYAALVLVTGIPLMAFNLVILRSFFMSIPAELLDSARIDGAGEFRILTAIAIRLSKGVIAVIALFFGVTYWNNFFNALLFLNSAEKWPLQLVLRTYVLQGSGLPGSHQAIAHGAAPPPTLATQMAVVVLAMIPVLLVYPFVQRHFVKGVIIGAVKG